MANKENCPRIDDKFFRKLLSSDMRMYYNTRYLNDKLYLHYKGFRKIENLEEFTGLKVLYIEGNALEKIEGLDFCTELRCLYMQENCIKEIQGLDSLINLHSLNLSDNLIECISGLSNLPYLETLQLQRNNIGRNGITDLQGLTEAKSVSVLDISNNRIDCLEVLSEVLYKMPSLAVLYLQGNPVCKKINNYRKELIVNIPNLKFLDDRPVFPEDRRFAEAFSRGGLQEEREERKRWDKEKEEDRMRNHQAFKEMIDKARAEREERKQEVASVNSTDESNPEASAGSQLWSSSTDGEADPRECSTPDSMEILLNEEDIRKINYDDVE